MQRVFKQVWAVSLGSVWALLGCVSEPKVTRPEPPPVPEPQVLSTCVAPQRPSARVKLTPAFGGLKIAAPVALLQAPRTGNELGRRWFALDQHGWVHSFLADAAGSVSDHHTVDVRSKLRLPGDSLGERGLLGIALHPSYPRDKRLFLHYTRYEGEDMVTRVSSFPLQGAVFDPAAETVLLSMPQPYSNHNGGHLLFGADGLLYVGTGDGGKANDPHDHGQNKQSLLGKMLRLDVDRQAPGMAYAIPSDNPFAQAGGRPEIYAYGLRNPWRYSFDRLTNELWVADVGQDKWEEIHVVTKGGNYGWNRREGFECFPLGEPCKSGEFVEPVHVYEHTKDKSQRSVTGGFVYRGSRLPELVGQYIFADYVGGELWALKRQDSQWRSELLLPSGFSISGFAEDEAGELYVLDYSNQRIVKLEPDTAFGSALPARISQTGCMDPAQPQRVSAGAIPYDIAWPFWSDGASKERFLALPKGTVLTPKADGDLELPPGAVTIKHFRLAQRLIETRFYVRHPDGEYSGYTYAWRADGSDADLVEETRELAVGEQTWILPGRGACNQCHTGAAGHSLGLELAQLAGHAKQAKLLTQWHETGVLAAAAQVARPFPSSQDEQASLNDRARAYLHVNCSSCHRPLGPARGTLDLRYATELAATGVCSTATTEQVGGADQIVTPGKAAQSVLVQRMSRRDEWGMPPLATRQVDQAGVGLITQWINSLSACP